MGDITFKIKTNKEKEKTKNNNKRKKLGGVAAMRSKGKGRITFTCIESIFNLTIEKGATPKGKYFSIFIIFY